MLKTIQKSLFAFAKRNRKQLFITTALVLTIALLSYEFGKPKDQPNYVVCTTSSARIHWNRTHAPVTFDYYCNFNFFNLTTGFTLVRKDAVNDSIKQVDALYGIGTEHACILQTSKNVLTYDFEEYERHTPPRYTVGEISLIGVFVLLLLLNIIIIMDSEKNRPLIRPKAITSDDFYGIESEGSDTTSVEMMFNSVDPLIHKNNDNNNNKESIDI